MRSAAVACLEESQAADDMVDFPITFHSQLSPDFTLKQKHIYPD